MGRDSKCVCIHKLPLGEFDCHEVLIDAVDASV